QFFFIEQRCRVRFPRLNAFSRRRRVSHRRGVVLIRQRGKMMSELVHKNVICKSVVHRDGAVEIKDSAAAVRAAVGEYFDEFVRSKLCDLAQALIVERENVALRSKGIVRRDRVAIDSGGWSRDSGLQRGRTKPPDVKIGAMLFEGRGREEDSDQAARVGLELSEFTRGVAITQQKQVNLRRRVAHFLNWNQLGG